jgi:catechol 2,3-dioxygenase-like lactoylglutathione lyase family enzyme
MALEFDHVAVPSNDIALSVEWYRSRLGARVLYQDSTWAFLDVGGQKLALVTPTQHPPHVAVKVSEAELEEAARAAGMKIDRHRDGTTGIYVYDPFGNAVELICYPPGETVYEAGGSQNSQSKSQK